MGVSYLSFTSNIQKEKKVVMITLTEECNQNPQCIYCYENHQSKEKMNFDTAKKIIDKEFSDKRFNYLEFDFFGGEPFLAFDLLKSIYEYIKSKKTSKEWICFATTNGMLVHDEIADWLKENREHFVCGLSLDGPCKVHNMNRPHSFEKIDINFFKNMYPQQQIKMTVSEKTLPYLADSIIYIHSLGFSLTSNLALGNKISWNKELYKDILSRQLQLLVDFYIKNPQITPCNFVNLGIEELYKDYGDFVPSWCGAGKSMVSYDISGNPYPCQYFMPLSIGEKSEKVNKLSFEKKINKNKLNSNCRNCVIRNICPTCFGANYSVSGNMYYKEESYCELLKIQFKASAYLFYNKLKLNQLNLYDEDKYKLLQGILMIQKNL